MTGKLTKSQAKFIKSLQQKKYRDLNKRFVVEGIKLVQEALQYAQIVEYVAYVGDIEDYPFLKNIDSYQVSSAELKSISSLKTPNKVLAICKMVSPFGKWSRDKPILALDEISDPGNLGAILRLADWFGIEQVICQPGSVDVYNPKVVQATMGSIFRVAVYYDAIANVIDDLAQAMPVYGAHMEGENLYHTEIKWPFMLVMGSESHGISEDLKSKITKMISIPRFGNGESLNVAISTGIILSELKRKTL